MNDLSHYMNLALIEAKKAFAEDEVPVGAIIVSEDGKVIASARNQKEKFQNPLSHAELEVIKKASENIGSWRLLNSTIYVTLEPCLMCLAAIREARISKLVFGAYDFKGGALSLGYNFNSDDRLNHRFKVIGGIIQNESSKLITDFFKRKRS